MTVSVFDVYACHVLCRFAGCQHVRGEGLAERQSIDDAWLKEYLAGEFTAIDGYDRATIGFKAAGAPMSSCGSAAGDLRRSRGGAWTGERPA